MPGPVQQQVETIITQTSAGAMYGGSGIGFVLTFFNTNAAGICAMVAVAGFIVNWAYKEMARRKANRK